jgi:hypothetical protein
MEWWILLKNSSKASFSAAFFSTLIFLQVLYSSGCFAQQDSFNYLHTNFMHKNVQSRIDFVTVALPLVPLKTGLFYNKSDSFNQGSFIPFMKTPVHYTAFFCKLENRVYNHFNVWLKFRAGNDELYRKMTDTR